MPSSLLVIATSILLPGLHLIIRLAPIWKDRHRGCDAYYFLQAAEAFRRQRRLPIVLPPYYLLEPQEQAYPPGMAMLLGILPEAWVQRFHWVFNSLIDIVSLALMSYWIGTEYGLGWVWAGGLAYMANASLTNEFGSLTSRSLALALTNAFLIVANFGVEGDLVAAIAATMLVVLLLYTHKLSTQLLWFLTPFVGLLLENPRWLLYVPVAYLIAYLLGRRVFVEILRAHWDILTFWNRNWSRLGAHCIRQSPIYRNGEDVGGGRFYQRHDPLWLASRLRKVLDYNCFVVFVPLMAVVWPALSEMERFALAWTVGTYVWGVLTYILRPLRSLGEGNKYFKYGLLPSLVLTASAPLRMPGWGTWLLIVLCAVWTIWAYVRTVRTMRGSMAGVTGQLTPPLKRIFDRVKAIEGARVLCLPLHLSDLTAYFTRRSVLWGTHGLGFKVAEPLFPVLLRPIEEFVRDYGLTHLILDESYVGLRELNLHRGSIVAREDTYLLWMFAGDESAGTRPS